MKKCNLSKIMKRSHEIKRLADERTKNSLMNRNICRPLKESEKAIFAICLSMAWAEARNENATWDTVAAAADRYVANSRYDEWVCNDWVKYGKNRTYIELVRYAGGRKHTAKCGYWDNIENVYVPEAKNCEVVNLLTA